MSCRNSFREVAAYVTERWAGLLASGFPALRPFLISTPSHPVGQWLDLLRSADFVSGYSSATATEFHRASLGPIQCFGSFTSFPKLFRGNVHESRLLFKKKRRSKSFRQRTQPAPCPEQQRSVAKLQRHRLDIYDLRDVPILRFLLPCRFLFHKMDAKLGAKNL